MGYYKQLHIDCSEDECLAGANNFETCWKQRTNVSYIDEDTQEQGKVDTSGDYDPLLDERA